MKARFFHTIYVALLIASANSTCAQPSVYCDYEGSWKIESVESPANSAYINLLSCNYYISPEGYVGCYERVSNEIFCECCWKRKGDLLVVPGSKGKVRYHIKYWGDKAIILTPENESGTIITFRKD